MYPTSLTPEPTQDYNCTNLKGILISQEVTLTSNGVDYVVPEGTGVTLYLSDGEFNIELLTCDMALAIVIYIFLLPL